MPSAFDALLSTIISRATSEIAGAVRANMADEIARAVRARPPGARAVPAAPRVGRKLRVARVPAVKAVPPRRRTKVGRKAARKATAAATSDTLLARAAPTLRNVRVVLNNGTDQVLTVRWFSALRGDWGGARPPSQGDMIQEQSSAQWTNGSGTLGVGAQASIRLECTAGLVDIAWHLPWVGELNLRVSVPTTLAHREDIDNRDPADVTVLIVLLPQKPKAVRAVPPKSVLSR